VTDQPERPVLTDDEALAVIRCAITAAGPAGQTPGELEQVTAWAVEAQLNAAALELVLKGEMGAFISDGELTWKLL
jgi:hypothetical protein